MIQRQPHYYTDFRCLGGACPDTCCRDWDIILDDKALADYQSPPPQLSPLLANSLVTDQEGDTCFRLHPDGRCALLTPDGLCSIQRDWGAQHLCAHCSSYPRFIEEYGSLTENSLAISCPEVAGLLLECPHFILDEHDDHHLDVPFPSIEPRLMDLLEFSRHQLFNHLQSSSVSIWESLSGMLCYAHRCQEYISDIHAPSAPFPTFSPGIPPQPSLHFSQSLCLFFASLAPLRPSWPRRLMDCHAFLSAISHQSYNQLCHNFHSHFPHWQQHISNFVCYLIFRHWHKTVNDDLLYGRAAFIACSAALLYHLLLHQWSSQQTLTLSQEISLFSAFGREIEHMEENLALAIDSCSTLSPADVHFPIS